MVCGWRRWHQAVLVSRKEEDDTICMDLYANHGNIVGDGICVEYTKRRKSAIWCFSRELSN